MEVYWGVTEEGLKKVRHNDAADIMKFYNPDGSLSAIENLKYEDAEIYKYSEDGKLMEIEAIDHARCEETMWIKKYNYDSDGRLVSVDKDRYYDGQFRKKIKNVTYYTYEELEDGVCIRREYQSDSNFKTPNEIKITNVKPGKEVELAHAYMEAEDCDINIYDPSGNLIADANDLGGEWNLVRYIYNNNGDVKGFERYYYNSRFPKISITYDDKGNVVKYVEYLEHNGELDAHNTYTHKYTYDKYGNWTSKKSKYEGAEGVYYYYDTRTYTYYK